ncbi:hypothetical protein [Mesorhizobium sp.]|uniref:hypothetical protein n=1 Tax=Mesorhizobium sp. TaxID=1871066 RepID=UPI00257BAD98|nr:hypothetical protein [Mesorhizobium sp.]
MNIGLWVRANRNGFSSPLPASELRIGNRSFHDTALSTRGRIQFDTVVIRGINKRSTHIVVIVVGMAA